VSAHRQSMCAGRNRIWKDRCKMPTEQNVIPDWSAVISSPMITGRGDLAIAPHAQYSRRKRKPPGGVSASVNGPRKGLSACSGVVWPEPDRLAATRLTAQTAGVTPPHRCRPDGSGTAKTPIRYPHDQASYTSPGGGTPAGRQSLVHTGRRHRPKHII